MYIDLMKCGAWVLFPGHYVRYVPLCLLVPVFVYEVGCVDDHPQPFAVLQQHHLAKRLEVITIESVS